jgi:hypothetical protein
MIIHLEDSGQDLLWLEIENSQVMDGGPLHGHIFKGRLLNPHSLKTGLRPEFSNGDRLRYPITRIVKKETAA